MAYWLPKKDGEDCCVVTEKRHPEQSELYDIRVWGTCKDGEQTDEKYGDRQRIQQSGEAYTVKKDGKVYVQKVTRKSDTPRGQRKATRATREVQALRDLQGTPFINNIHEAFQTPSELVLVLDFVEGGTLFEVITQAFNHKESLTDDEIRFYLAEIVLALEAVHKNNIVHRDIKGDNILLSKDGHIQLADFGLCKYLDEDTGRNSFVGTDIYMAPELLVKEWRSDKCEIAQDWYSVGVLGLQMYVGADHLPYGCTIPYLDTDARKELLSEAMRSGVDPNIPSTSYFGSARSNDLRDLLAQLLKLHSSQRLGREGSEQVKEHIFFKDVSWEDAANKALGCPQRRR